MPAIVLTPEQHAHARQWAEAAAAVLAEGGKEPAVAMQCAFELLQALLGASLLQLSITDRRLLLTWAQGTYTSCATRAVIWAGENTTDKENPS